MRFVTKLLVGAVVALVPRSGLGTELELGLEAGVGFDDNVLSSATNEEADVYLRLGPRISVQDPEGAFRWQVYYRPRYDKYVDLDEIDGWDHNAYASVEWDISPATSLEVNDHYIDYDNFTSIFSEEIMPDGSVDTGVEFGRRRIRQNAASASIMHYLAPRHFVGFTAKRYDNRFFRDIVTDSEVTLLSADYVFSLRPQDRIGVQLRGTRQEISDELRNERTTDFYNVSGTWGHDFDSTFGFEIAAGPTWIDSDEQELPTQLLGVRFPILAREDGTFGHVDTATCPRLEDGSFFLGEGCQALSPAVFPFVFPPQVVVLGFLGDERDTDQDLTYFASARLSKRWRNYRLALSYLRDASTTADISGSVRDTFTVSLTWVPARRWSVTFSAYYETREEFAQGVAAATVLRPLPPIGLGEAVGFQIVDVENEIEVDTYFAGIYASYALNRQTKLFGNVSWHSQTTESSFGKASLDRVRVVIGVIYTLPAFELPI